MLTRAAAAGLMGIVPEKVTASVALIPDSGSTVTVSCPGCWLKPLKSTDTSYAGVMLSGRETIINVPDASLNPLQEGRVIRAGHEITVNGTVYIVQVATLKGVRTRWECLVTDKQ